MIGMSSGGQESIRSSDTGMRPSDLLESVWQGHLHLAEGAEAQRMTRLLRALLPGRLICLTARAGVERTCVMSDETELMPALPLGDVLAEELGLDVPYGTLVVVDADAAHWAGDDEALSYHLGHVVGEALLCLVRRGAFALERETDALYAMACSYHRLAEAARFQHLGLLPQAFRSGLAAVLGVYWSGARSSRTETSGLFLTPDFLVSPKTLNYLRTIDGGFTSPDPARIHGRMMLLDEAALDLDDWAVAVEAAVSAELAAQDRLSPKVRIS